MIYYILIFYMMMIYLLLILMFLYFFYSQVVIYLELELFKISSMKVEFLILIDWISLLFLSVIMLISMMVILYSIEYMEDDLNINRFMMLIFMFILSMMFMILSPNLISILFGWDGLGLTSYCLVIYYQNKVSYNSGMITVLMNRVGDILILLAIGLFSSLGSWNFMYLGNLNIMIYTMLIFASFTKSAQIPFSSWLPLAMAAPTPVSSLVHSSTLVTAGVYLMIRFNYLLINKNLINLIMIISLVTMFMSGLAANYEYDLKKVIALSTLSQLGLMIFSLIFNCTEITLFHLLTHAMFKSMLFMSAGIIIHNSMGIQDMRVLGMGMFNLPLTSVFFNCSILSLCGIPFMSGFFSKDLILEMFLMNLNNKLILIVLFTSMGLTVSYSLRMMYFTFFSNSQLMINLNVCELKNKMVISMYLLFFMTIMKGSMLSWVLFSMKNYIFLSTQLKLLIYIFMIMGGLLGLLLMNFKLLYNYLLDINLVSKFFSILWFVELFYSLSLLSMFVYAKLTLADNLEFGWSEYLANYSSLIILIKFSKFDLFSKNYLYCLITFIFILLIFVH